MIKHKLSGKAILRNAILVILAALIINIVPAANIGSPAYGQDLGMPDGPSEFLKLTEPEEGLCWYPPDYNLPNIGLKNPGEISWPYGEGFAYKANMGNFLLDLPGAPENIAFVCGNGRSSGNGVFAEQFDMAMSEMGITINMTVKFFTFYDTRHLAQTFGVNIDVDIDTPVPLPFKVPEVLLTYRGAMVDGRIVENTRCAELFGEKLAHDDYTDREAPDTGFFFTAGTATPGLTALMLSAIDLERRTGASVWVTTMDFIEIENAKYYGVMRADIRPIRVCEAHIQKIWNDTRGLFQDWVPPENIRTFVFSVADYGPLQADSPIFCYVDDADRLIRMEQVVDGEPILIELIESNGPLPWG